jgi:NTP pyrophosphatase (non-canonical NTP hydrolase)
VLTSEQQQALQRRADELVRRGDRELQAYVAALLEELVEIVDALQRGL